jgi:hypothetical protein
MFNYLMLPWIFLASTWSGIRVATAYANETQNNKASAFAKAAVFRKLFHRHECAARRIAESNVEDFDWRERFARASRRDSVSQTAIDVGQRLKRKDPTARADASRQTRVGMLASNTRFNRGTYESGGHASWA